jgi:hypothetical protein
MRRTIAIGMFCGALAACAPPPAGSQHASLAPPESAAPHADLRSARAACNDAYPAKIGNYLAHANCVNQAVEAYALPGARYPDLVRLQEEVRSRLSARIDDGTISAHDGERQMAQADRAIAEAERERDAADTAAADRHVAGIQALLSE